MTTKTCSRCTYNLSVDSFHRKGDGLQSWCKSCKSKVNRQYPAPPRFAICSLCLQPHERKILRNERNHFCSQPCRSKASQLRMKYGLEPSDWRMMWERQEGTCAMPKCNTKLEMFGTAGHHVDHNHKTGKVRGLLCHACNVGLGWYERMKPIGADEYLKGE